MGIDARILVRTKSQVTEEDLKKWSYLLCNTFSADEFFISRKSGKGAIELTEDYEEEGRKGKVFFQDGPEILAEEGETFLKVNLWTRYYGEGYERGDCLLICAIAEWCEANVPNCAVWYGGDSSGICAKPFGEEERRALRAHLYSAAGRDYFESMGSMDRGEFTPPTSDCKLCISGRSPRRSGWGGNYAAYYCGGCGEYFTTRDNGVTWTLGKEEGKL